MSCHVCSRAPNSRLPFCCATCARSHLYQLRVEHARVLLEKESIGKQIENAVAYGEVQDGFGESDKGAVGSNTEGWTIQTSANSQTKSSTRTKALRSHIETLAAEIKDKKLDISQRRLTLTRRKSDAESAKYQLMEREAAMLTGIQNSTKRTDHLWHSLHNKTAEARIFLCREAANIYGLRQKNRRVNGDLQETYVLGGMPIIDLRDMNGKLSSGPSSWTFNVQDTNAITGATPAQISTSFSNIAHLLVLISHYLSLRLPAEITLPHRNYPTPTIYTPTKSYLSRESPSATGQSSSGSATPRTPDSRPHIPRPRPLFIDRNLPKLAREDPGAYALFLEAATLLAWNVSWLSRTQGLNLNSDSWEEICDIGKNIWQLLVAPPVQASTLMRAYAGRDLSSKSRAPKDSPKTTIQRTKTFSMLGHYSHGTAHSFLSASEGTEFMRTWKLPTPTKVVDKLKSTLLGEMASAEWELLEKKEWDDEEQFQHSQPSRESHNTAKQDYERGMRSEKNGSDFTSAISSENGGINLETNEQTDTGRLKGTSGWTKLRNR